MQFRGDNRVLVLLEGDVWLIPPSFGMFKRSMRRMPGDWLTQKHVVDDVSFREGSRVYTLSEYEQKVRLPLRKWLSGIKT